MTDINVTLPPARRRALELLADPPANPDASKGYLDLLGDDSAVAKNAGAIQAVWASPIGSLFYDNAQALARRFFTAWQHAVDWLNIPQGGTALDVGCGPGNVTGSLGRAVGPDGLALGVDISKPMLARAFRAQSGPQVGSLRADAQRLPLRDDTVDALVPIAVLQLVPDPVAAVAEMAQVLRPGRAAGLNGAHHRASGPAISESFRTRAHTYSAMTSSPTSSKTTASSACGPRVHGPIQWVRGKR